MNDLHKFKHFLGQFVFTNGYKNLNKIYQIYYNKHLGRTALIPMQPKCFLNIKV